MIKLKRILIRANQATVSYYQQSLSHQVRLDLHTFRLGRYLYLYAGYVSLLERSKVC